MREQADRRSAPRSPNRAVLTLSLAVIGSASLLTGHADAFKPYFRAVHPVVATTAAVALGAFCLMVLESRGWFRIKSGGEVRDTIRISIPTASVLALIAVLADLSGAFPPDINVALPQSLLFYPVMGYVVEAVFHLAPLTLLLVLFSGVPDRYSHSAIAGCLVAVALIEPGFQVRVAPASPGWVREFVAVHLLLFNVIQLWLLKRSGFLTMYFFRVIYYLEWHILWGYARLL